MICPQIYLIYTYTYNHNVSLIDHMSACHKSESETNVFTEKEKKKVYDVIISAVTSKTFQDS